MTPLDFTVDFLFFLIALQTLHSAREFNELSHTNVNMQSKTADTIIIFSFVFKITQQS